MRLMMGALRRFGWLVLALAPAVGLFALFVEGRSRPVRHEAVARAAGRGAPSLLKDPVTAQVAAALVKAHHDERGGIASGYWKGASEAALRKRLEDAKAVPDPARWPEVRISDGPRIEVAVEEEQAFAVSADPAEAKLAANARVAAAMLVGAAYQRLAAERVESLSSRLQVAESDARPIEESGRELERRLSALQTSADALERQKEDVRARQDRALVRIRLLEAAEHRLREALPAGAEEEGLTSPLLDKLAVERESLRAERDGKPRTTEDPEVRRLNAKMAEVDGRIRAELFHVRGRTLVTLRNSLDSMEGELRTLDERRLRKSLEIRELSEEIRIGAPRRGEVERLRADLALAEKERLDLGADDVPLALVAEEAVDTLRRGGGRAGVAWSWGAVGAVAGLLLALLLAAFDRRIRSGDDVKRRLGLGVIGLAGNVKGDPLLLRAPTGGSTSSDYSLSAGVLRGYMAEREFKTVLITSAGAAEGKSTAAANLAVALARKGMNVALVDADLRAPRQAAIFNLDDSQGLATLLLGGEFQPDLPAGATEFATLRVLTAGPTADLPAELLDTQRMAEIVQGLRERFDVVVIDGPPVGAGGDAVTLARLADTTAWVVRAGRLSAGRLGWVKHLLKSVGADVAGILLVGSTDAAADREYSYPVAASR